MKNCIIVLGMHRSGTSALMGTLNLCGVDLGKNLLGATEHNQKGYFENKAVVDFNEELLRRMGTLWYDIDLIDDIKLTSLIHDEKLKKEAISIIDKEFLNNQLIGIKDPRMCLLFPFWSTVLESLGYKINIIMTFREPFEIVNSLHKRDGMDINFTLLLWAKYSLYAEKYSRNFKRYFSMYSNLLNNPKEEILSVVKFFGLNFPLLTDAIFNHFIDIKLNRSSSSISNLWLPDFVKQTMDFYKIMVTSNEKEFSKEFDLIFELFVTYHQFFFNPSTISLFNIKFNTEKKNKQLFRRFKKFLRE